MAQSIKSYNIEILAVQIASNLAWSAYQVLRQTTPDKAVIKTKESGISALFCWC